jgi:glycosyltransferase involved in cell wall biosynthesis
MALVRTGESARDPAATEPAPQPPLRVLIGLEGMALGGCPINALDLGRTLRARGHHVSVFAIEEDVRVSLLPYAERCGFAVTRLPAATGIVPLSRRIHALAERQSADVVHVFAPWLGPAATVATATGGRRTAVVTNWTMANVDYTPRRTPLILGTAALQREAQARHGSPVWLLEPPVDVELDRPDPAAGQAFRAEVGLAADETAVVVVSRLDADKAEGIRYAIRTVARLDRPGLRLVVVGDGNAAAELRQEAAAANRALGRPAVVLAGARADPHPAYAAADVALGMGGSALRALAHGAPLVVLGEHGFARVFEPATVDYFYEAGFFGTTAEPDPVGHLAGVLAGLDADRRRVLGPYGLAEVRGRFGLAVGAGRLEEIYRAGLAAVPGPVARGTAGAYVLGRALGHQARRAVRRGRA